MAKKKNQLTADAKALRNALYPPGDSLDFPSFNRKEAVHQAILKLPGNSWYDSHRHLTWCSGREKTIRNANQKLAQSVMPAIENFLQTHLVHTPNPPFSVLRQWAAANGVGVSIIADILDTMMPEPTLYPGPAHKGSTDSNMQDTAAVLDGHSTAFSNYNDKSEPQAFAYTSWSTPGVDSADDLWNAGEGSALLAYQHAPDAPYFHTGDE